MEIDSQHTVKIIVKMDDPLTTVIHKTNAALMKRVDEAYLRGMMPFFKFQKLTKRGNECILYYEARYEKLETSKTIRSIAAARR